MAGLSAMQPVGWCEQRISFKVTSNGDGFGAAASPTKGVREGKGDLSGREISAFWANECMGVGEGHGGRGFLVQDG